MENIPVVVIPIKSCVRTAVIEALEMVGGIEHLIQKNELVVLKPNFVAARRADTGVTTDFQVIEAVAAEVRKQGARPVIVEVPGMEFDFDQVYDFLEVRKFAKECDIGIYEKNNSVFKLLIPNGKALKTVKLPDILEHAKIINLPKLKGHGITKLTGAMKNLMGLLPVEERRKMHIHGIHQAIVDVNKAIKPILTIMDCTTSMEGDAVFGNTIKLNHIIAGTDNLAVDEVGIRLLGHQPAEIEHLRLAKAQSGMRNIQVLGDIDFTLNRIYNIPERPSYYQLLYRSMYYIDVPFFALFHQHFNSYLYSRGLAGNRPVIIKTKCDQCGRCVEICPVNGAINLNSYEINHAKCIKCLLCIENCPETAIGIKSFLRPIVMRNNSCNLKEKSFPINKQDGICR
jgi:uncharacterized protein (DUF362 family)/ferredoxin